MRQGVHLPQDFDGAELHGEAGLPGHVDAVVEHDDAAVAEHAASGRHLLVAERRVEQVFGEIGAERAADLHRADRPARARAAAEILHQLADRGAERQLHQPAALDVAGELERLRAERAAHAISRISLRAVIQDPGDRGEARARC